MLQLLMSDDTEFNDLEADFDFFQEFIDMPEEEEAHAKVDFMKEVMERLNERKCCAQLITIETWITGSSSFPIMDRRVYEKIKFEFIALLIIGKLKQNDNKKVFIDTFNTVKDQTLSYWTFKKLIVETLGIQIPEDWAWIYEDLEFLLDSDDTADLCLEDC